MWWKSWIAWGLSALTSGYFIDLLWSKLTVVVALFGGYFTTFGTMVAACSTFMGHVYILLSPFTVFFPFTAFYLLLALWIGFEMSLVFCSILLRVTKWITDTVPTGG